MLKTLDNYLDYEQTSEWLLEPFWWRFTRNRRFIKIFVASVVGHLVFYAVLIRLDVVMRFDAVDERAPQTELVKVAELAPPPGKDSRLRAAPEALERVDTSNLHYQPETANDTSLTARSPKPTVARGNQGKLPTASQVEAQARVHSTGTADAVGKPSPPAPAPQTNPVATSGKPQPDSSIAAATIPTPAVPPPPQPKANTSTPAANPQPAASAGQRDGNASQTATLGLQASEAQYFAYVRAKIRKTNEGIMPRNWIADVLAREVSTEFSIVVRRSGQIASLQRTRSSGYSLLDDVARQAIYMANPFDGYPQNAGDTITLTVTVYYTPGR